MNMLLQLVRRHLLPTWRFRWAAIAFAWVICALGWTGTWLIPNQYEASARLYVDADAVLTPLLHGIALDSVLGGQLDLLQRTLLSRPNLERLIAKTDLELQVGDTISQEAMLARLQTDIKINAQTRNLFTITYRNPNPKLAYDVVQTILSIFIESKAGSNRADMENAQTFLQQQIDSYERQLRDAEKRRADFRAKYLDLLPAGDGGISGLEQAREAVRKLQGDLKDNQARHTQLEAELKNTPQVLSLEETGTGGGGGDGGARQRIADAERELAELRLRYTDNHPDVIAAQRRLAALRAGGAIARSAPPAAPAAPRPVARNGSVPNPMYEQIKIRMVETDNTVASLTRQLNEAQQNSARLEAEARTAPGLQADFLNINRDYDVLRKNYEELLARRESMRIATAAEDEANKVKMQVIDPPVVPQIPVAPKRILMLTAVLGVGLAGGGALAFLMVQFDRSFHSIDDLRDLGLPVLGGISLVNVVHSLRQRVLAAATFGAAVLLLCAVYGGLLWRLLFPAEA
jgi:polysaccharide chain length determinant protein (PEP-CTERM system associated)